MPPAVHAAYVAMVEHSAACLDCRKCQHCRDEGGKVTGQCPDLDALEAEYYRTRREARSNQTDTPPLKDSSGPPGNRRRGWPPYS